MNSDFFVSDDKTLYNIPLVHDWISHTYWGEGRTLEETRLVLENSAHWFGLYRSSDKSQAGCARILSDRLTLGYLSDVFILPELRGKGLGRMLLEEITRHPEIQSLRRLNLYTKTPDFYRGFFAEYFPEDGQAVYMHRKQGDLAETKKEGQA